LHIYIYHTITPW